MKRIKSLCIALVLALLVTYVPVSAAVQDDTMIKMQQKDTSQVELALYPNGDMIKNHSTTFRIQMRITEAESGSIGEIHFAFSEEIQNRCKIREYFYENGILDIYFSSAGTVFEQAQDVVIGTISGTPSGEMFRASIAPESIMFVDQSHQMKQVDEGVLQGISYQWAVGEKVPDPDNPNPDNPNPDNPNPDNPNPDNPNPDNPNPDNPNPDNPNPDNPNPDNPNPDNPNPDNPNPDNPNPDNPDPDDPNPDKPNPDENPEYPDGVCTASTYEELEKGLADSGVTSLIYKSKDGNGLTKEQQKTLFKSLKGTERTLTIIAEEKGQLLYSWKFTGTGITNIDTFIDFGIANSKENKDARSLMAKGAENLYLEFAHEGELPGLAEIELYAGDSFQDGQNLYLYYYNTKKNGVEPIQKSIKVVDGYVTIQIEHCSTYILTTKLVRKDEQFPAVTVNKTDGTKKTPVKPTTKTTAKTAKTGDDTPVEGLLLLAGISAAAMILIGKSRKKI
ncbi:hypothetical protein K040078D81_29130 [Blautia hominis]|uniref:Gram-positive cocci surface proteins LPxTG domain-containing protein n=1 Tax=Blautia hominis TaxID=2025493 RepID=A0ABQ0BBG3_9FIRM